MEEKRRSKRLDLSVTIQMERIDSPDGTTTVKYATVDVHDLSRGGIGFSTNQELQMHTYYNTQLVIWTKETIDAIIEIVRVKDQGNGTWQYGAVFIGMSEAEALKIDIYQIIQETKQGG